MQIKNKEKIIKISLFFLPFFDAINGYLIRRAGIYGIGSAYHLFLLMLLTILTYGNRLIKVGLWEKESILLLISFVISGIGNYFINSKFESISLERVEKICCTCIFLTILFRLGFSHDDVINIFDVQCIFVLTITLFADFTKLGNYTYQYSRSGMVGFYNGSNEPVVIFTIISVYLLDQLALKISIKRLILFFMSILSLIFVQSKASYAFAFFFSILFIIVFCNNTIRTRHVGKSVLLIGVPTIIIALFLARNVIINTIESFLSRQQYQQRYYLDEGVLHYLSSGRTLRIQRLIIDPIQSKSFLIKIFQILFGQGLSFGYSETIEMDYLDTFMYGGLSSLTILTGITIHVYQSIGRLKSRRIYIIGFILSILFSFFAGHVWTGGSSGFYFALFAVYCKSSYNTAVYNKTRIEGVQ